MSDVLSWQTQQNIAKEMSTKSLLIVLNGDVSKMAKRNNNDDKFQRCCISVMQNISALKFETHIDELNRIMKERAVIKIVNLYHIILEVLDRCNQQAAKDKNYIALHQTLMSFKKFM